MLLHRILTALVMITVFLSLLFWAPDRVWFAAICTLMAWSAMEWSNLAGFSKPLKAAYVLLMPVILAVVWMAIHQWWLKQVFWLLLLLATVFWMIVVPVWLFVGWHVKSKLALALSGVMALVPAGVGFLYMRGSQESAWTLLALLAVVWVADCTAYFVGRMFGKHKLAPSISPGKSVGGAIGAVVGVAAYLGTVMYVVEPQILLVAKVGWVELLMMALLLAYQSILGDLYESWLKRCAGIKDSGSSLPGHGGILDRIDAILPVLPLQLILLNWLTMR